jgi:hypothetical protein
MVSMSMALLVKPGKREALTGSVWQQLARNWLGLRWLKADRADPRTSPAQLFRNGSTIGPLPRWGWPSHETAQRAPTGWARDTEWSPGPGLFRSARLG